MWLFQHTILKEGFEAFLLSLMAQMEESKAFGVSSNIGVFRSATFKAKKSVQYSQPFLPPSGYFASVTRRAALEEDKIA